MPPYIKELPFLIRPRSEERYLVIQLTPAGAQATLLRLDAERVLRFERFWSSFTWEGFAHGRTPQRLLPNVILVGHPLLSGSASVPVRIDRPQGSASMSQTDFESHLRQTHVKLWNDLRPSAAETLGVAPVDAVLVDLRVTDLKVDGRDVVSPLDVAGERIDLTFTVAFTTRAVFEAWQPLFSMPKGFFFTDSARAALRSLEVLPDMPISLIVADTWGTHYIKPRSAKEYSWLEKTVLPWNVVALPGLLEKAWGLGPEAAAEAHAAYCAGAVSPHAAAAIRAIYASHIAAFEKAVTDAKIKGSAALLASVALPPELAEKRPGLNLVPFPTDTLLEHFHFSLPPDALFPYDRSSIVAPLIQFYYHNTYAEVNLWLKRRVHWLIPSHR